MTAPTSPAPSADYVIANLSATGFYPDVDALTPITQMVTGDTWISWFNKTQSLIATSNTLTELSGIVVKNVTANTARGCGEVRGAPGTTGAGIVWIGVNAPTGSGLTFADDGSLKVNVDPTVFGTDDLGVLTLKSNITNAITAKAGTLAFTVNQAHTFTVSQIVYLPTSGTWALATSADVLHGNAALGMVTTVIDSNNFIVTLSGLVDLGASNATIDGTPGQFVTGTIYYLNTGGAPGTLTVTRPLGVNTAQKVIAVGIANGTGINKAILVFSQPQINEYLRLDGTGSAQADLNMGGFRLKSVATAITGTDAVPLFQLNAALASATGSFVAKSGDTMSGALNMGSNKVTFVSNGSVTGDAVNFGQLSGKFDKAGGSISGNTDFGGNQITGITGAATGSGAVNLNQLNGKVAKSGDTMSGILNMGSNKIQGLASGATAADAVNKGQMDTADGLRVLKTGDTMSGPLNMGSQRITSMATGATGSDAATLSQVNDLSSSILLYLSNYMMNLSPTGTQTITSSNPTVFTGPVVIDGVLLMNMGINMSGSGVINLPDPSVSKDAMNYESVSNWAGATTSTGHALSATPTVITYGSSSADHMDLGQYMISINLIVTGTTNLTITFTNGSYTASTPAINLSTGQLINQWIYLAAGTFGAGSIPTISLVLDSGSATLYGLTWVATKVRHYVANTI